jgi:hypothetical protein
MGPHADDFYRSQVIQSLVNQPMLDVDPPGAGACQVTNQSLERRWRVIGIFSEKVQQTPGLGLETGTSNFL